MRGSPPPTSAPEAMEVEAPGGGHSEPIAEDASTLTEEPVAGGTPPLFEQDPIKSDENGPHVGQEKWLYSSFLLK
ncbi:UNVERIFIED_CONTAM: hypothetical protein Slati_4469000 [Sesamum latifolium]|uniref:Uncharacterized protein n=1 Tax=Sesamum latifolium TaxID=2727402 RepID=A0AAW2ST34_9LAMI